MTSFAIRMAPSGPPVGGTPGYYWTVGADGKTVELVPPGAVGGVTSWNTRTGAVTPALDDYSASLILNDAAGVPGLQVSGALISILATANAAAAAAAAAAAEAFVAGTPQIGFVVGWDGAQKIWEAVPVAFAINSFAKVGSTLVLAGATVVTPSFTASYNQSATAVTLTDTLGHSDPIALPGTAFVSPHSFPLLTYGASVTFTDTASSPLGSAARSVTLSAGNNVYFGSAVDPGGGGYTSAFANSLTAILKQAPNGTYAYAPGATESCFFWVRSAFGLTVSNFTVNGFPFACSIVAAAVPVTNVNGVTETYDLVRSDVVGLGPFNLVES